MLTLKQWKIETLPFNQIHYHSYIRKRKLSIFTNMIIQASKHGSGNNFLTKNKENLIASIYNREMKNGSQNTVHIH